MKTTKNIEFRGIAAAFFFQNVDKFHEKHLISGNQLRYTSALIYQYSLRIDEKASLERLKHIFAGLCTITENSCSVPELVENESCS